MELMTTFLHCWLECLWYHFALMDYLCWVNYWYEKIFYKKCQKSHETGKFVLYLRVVSHEAIQWTISLYSREKCYAKCVSCYSQKFICYSILPSSVHNIFLVNKFCYAKMLDEIIPCNLQATSESRGWFHSVTPS